MKDLSSGEIGGCLREQFGVVTEMPHTSVAVMAEQTTDFLCLMAMVNDKATGNGSPTSRMSVVFSTYSANPTLLLKQSIVSRKAKPVTRFQPLPTCVFWVDTPILTVHMLSALSVLWTRIILFQVTPPLCFLLRSTSVRLLFTLFENFVSVSVIIRSCGWQPPVFFFLVSKPIQSFPRGLRASMFLAFTYSLLVSLIIEPLSFKDTRTFPMVVFTLIFVEDHSFDSI